MIWPNALRVMVRVPEGLGIGKVLRVRLRRDTIGREPDRDDTLDLLEAEDAAPWFLKVGPKNIPDLRPELAIIDAVGVEPDRGGRPMFGVAVVDAEEDRDL
jgi:hypothetical protein